MKMMMKVMLMKIVVCVSDEVLNSQHYKHSQSTEASDQYANELILYLNELLNEDCSFVSSCLSLYLHITLLNLFLSFYHFNCFVKLF